MQPNKKYVAGDGKQYAMYPTQFMNITQSINGSYSHMGTNAIDDAQQNTGIQNGYAPCDMRCVATDYKNGNAMFWQSVNPVHTVKYGLTHIYMMVIHDNTANAKVGLTVPQGTQLFSEGTAGMATGNHNHIEVGIGAYKGMYVLNGYGVYMMPGNVRPDDVFFANDTQIINGGGLNWRTIPKEAPSFSTSQLIQEDGIATLTVDNVRARRDTPTGSVVRTYNAGNKVRYYWKWVGNGHRYVVWKEGNAYIFLAVSGSEERGVEPWATFSAPEESKPTPPKPTPSKPAPKPEPPKKEFPDSVKFKGVDISEHNKDFDVKGNDFVIIRASFGTNTDKQFLNNVKKCRDDKIPFGLYVYDYALNDEQANEEADYILDLMKSNDVLPQLGVWFDMEDADHYKQKNDVLTKERCTNSCKIFCDKLKQKGYYTGIYASSSWFGNMIDELGYPKWVANWGTNDGTCQGDFSKQAVMHQYCANPLDKDVMYVSMETMKSNPKEDVPLTPIEPSKPSEKPQHNPFPSELDIEEINKYYKNMNELLDRILG